MQRPVRVLTLATALAAPVVALAEQSTWSFDPMHTASTFTVRHLVVSTVRGEFGKTTGTVKLDDKDIARSSVEATIDASTVNTRVEKRDADLRSENFFDVAKYPTITFKSTRIEKAGEGKYRVMGDLTMHGTTKPVVLDATLSSEIKDPMGTTQRRGFSATTKLNRKEFGLNWNKMIEAGPVVSDNVNIEIDGEMAKQGPKRAAK